MIKENYNADLDKKSSNNSNKSRFKSLTRQNNKAIFSSYFCGKSHFKDDGTQNYLVSDDV